MNRGSASVTWHYPSLSPRFNEAPIHESGKLNRYPIRCIRPVRFNEAPIHESGKCSNPLRT